MGMDDRVPLNVSLDSLALAGREERPPYSRRQTNIYSEEVRRARLAQTMAEFGEEAFGVQNEMATAALAARVGENMRIKRAKI